MIQLAFYTVDCESMIIGAMRYMNDLTMNKKQVKIVKIWQNYSFKRVIFP